MPGVRLPHLSSRATLLALLALLVLTAGSSACGKRGDPLPPFQHIPSPVPKARVSQRGPVILIEWEAPTKTTDGSELRLTQVEVLRRIVEPPPPVPEAPLTPEILDTEGMPGITDTEGEATPGAGTAVEPAVAPAGLPTALPITEDAAQPDSAPPAPPAPKGEPTEKTPTETESPSQETAEETTESPPEGQTEGDAEGEEPLVMAAPLSILPMTLKPKRFGEEARIIAKLEVDPSGSPLFFEDEWKPRWQGKKLEYAVRYVNPKGLKGAHSGPSLIHPRPPLPAPSALSAMAGDGYVKITWEESAGLAEWQEAVKALIPEGVKLDFGFNVYRRPREGVYRSAAPVNRKPVEETLFEDRNVRFGSVACYVVRSVVVPIILEPSPVVPDEGGAVSDLKVPSEGEIDALAAAVEEVPPGVAAGLQGTAAATLETTKQLQPPEPQALVESESTNEVCLKPIDIFPPAAPSRLVALETPDGIMISWGESDARDLKGFLIYRADKKRGPFELLTKEPIPLPGFTDSDVSPGETYFYAVSAVDSAELPNESEPSSPIAATALK